MAGTVAIRKLDTFDNTDKDIRMVAIVWEADALDGSVPDTIFPINVFSSIFGYKCTSAIVLPDEAAPPTDGYSPMLVDENGMDVFGGELNARSSVTKETLTPKIGQVYCGRLCSGRWVFTLAGNSVNSAKGKIILHFSEKGFC